MKERLFRFKQFSVRHELSAMKVGVDAVLLGAWADTRDVHYVLDVGTGCGVIALAIAQRAPEAMIHAIDIDLPSIQEAGENFKASPWHARLKAENIAYSALFDHPQAKYDLIVSNPPFFDSGVDPQTDSRMRARHIGALSPFVIVETAGKLLTPHGRVALITPAEMEERLCRCADESGLQLLRSVRVKGTPSAQPKRLLSEFGLKGGNEAKETAEILTIQTSPEVYTDDYIALTQEYYIKF